MKSLLSHFFLALILVTGAGALRGFAQSAPAKSTTEVGILKSQVLAGTQVQGRRAIAMAKGIPADKFTWTPGNGGRTVANLFLHLAFSFWTRPAAFGAAAPAGFDPTQKADAYENSTTDKEKVVEQLTQAAAYAESSLRNLSEADLQKHIKAGGRETTVAAVLAAWLGDNSEHVGQLMVYSRIHGFAPPNPGQVATPQDGQ
jgi:uncharacterized damage-inducible protein DinB